jgi:cytoskeletal protein RodZ
MRILIWTNVGHTGVLNIFTIYALATRTTVTSLTTQHRAAFQPAVSVQEVVTKLSSSDKSENSTLISVIKHFHEKMWEHVSTENEHKTITTITCWVTANKSCILSKTIKKAFLSITSEK